MKSKNNSKTEVIHYHRDTEDICNTLIKGSAYRTSKGLLVYIGRSQSNGKIMFRSTDEPKNVYFTKKEWDDGNNSHKNMDKDYVKKVSSDSKKELEEAAVGLIPNKSIVFDNSDDVFGNCQATYIGVGVHGIKVRYHDSVHTIVHFSSKEFRRRFTLVEMNPKRQKAA